MMTITTSLTEVILVNHKDEYQGTCEKLWAHQQGLLHRAFSVFIIDKKHNNKIRVLLQKRHETKYHSAGLWTNTCCSHPLPTESVIEGAQRRLKEEMGIINIPLKTIGTFHYTASVGNDLIENELDHVLIGELDSHNPDLINPDFTEISEYAWVDIQDLKKALCEYPENYTAWLAQVLEFVEKI